MKNSLMVIKIYFTGMFRGAMDYAHTQKVCEEFGMKTMRDYHTLFNDLDILLLVDIFENFRSVLKLWLGPRLLL